MSLHDGREGAERVKRICERAHLVLKLGTEALERLEAPLPPCDCRYPDGRARFVGPDRALRHRCGR